MNQKGAHKKRAKLLASQIKENFSEDIIFKQFSDACDSVMVEQLVENNEEVFVV